MTGLTTEYLHRTTGRLARAVNRRQMGGLAPFPITGEPEK